MIQDEVGLQRMDLPSVGTPVMGTAAQHIFVESGPDPSTLRCESRVAS